MRLQVVRAIYKGGTLIFTQPELTPRDGTEVILTYVEEVDNEEKPTIDPIRALRGRGERRAFSRKIVTVETRG